MFTIEEAEENKKKIQENYRIPHIVQEKDLKHYRPNTVKAGETIMADPEPSNVEEAWKRIEYHSALMCEQEKIQFLQRNNLTAGTPPEVFKAAIHSVLYATDTGLHTQIEKFKQTDLVTANQMYGDLRDNDLYVFKRLDTGYYKRLSFEDYPGVFPHGMGLEVKVYSRYFLFYSFLKNLLSPTKSQKYSNKELAIACYLLGITIDESNAERFLKKYTSNTHPEKLLKEVILKSTPKTKLSTDKGSTRGNTEHLESLKAAKELILKIGGKNKEDALVAINEAIPAFERNRNLRIEKSTD